MKGPPPILVTCLRSCSQLPESMVATVSDQGGERGAGDHLDKLISGLLFASNYVYLQTSLRRGILSAHLQARVVIDMGSFMALLWLFWEYSCLTIASGVFPSSYNGVKPIGMGIEEQQEIQLIVLSGSGLVSYLLISSSHGTLLSSNEVSVDQNHSISTNETDMKIFRVR